MPGNELIVLPALLLAALLFSGCTSQQPAAQPGNGFGPGSHDGDRNFMRGPNDANFRERPDFNGMPPDRNFRPGFGGMPPGGFENLSDENFLQISARVLGLPEGSLLGEINFALGIDDDSTIQEAKDAFLERMEKRRTNQ